MAIDVSSLVRLMNGYKEDNPTIDSSAGKSTALITRDLLGEGGCRTIESTELDLDLQVPSGFEKRLDLKSGKVYLHKCNSQNKHQYSNNGSSFQKLQDLNFSPSSKQTLNFFDESTLELKLVSSPPSSQNYQSVCTLDKVRSALERAEREPRNKRCSVSKSSSPSSLVRETSPQTDYDERETKQSSSYAAGCPSCLLYVLISRNNPRCPRCHTIVPYPTAMKKPRIDLNVSL